MYTYAVWRDSKQQPRLINDGKMIINVSGDQQQQNTSPVDEAIERAVKHFFDPALAALEEPCGLASGDTSMAGKFIIADDEVDDEDIHENR